MKKLWHLELHLRVEADTLDEAKRKAVIVLGAHWASAIGKELDPDFPRLGETVPERKI